MKRTKFVELSTSKIYFQVIMSMDVFYTEYAPDHKPVRDDYGSSAEFQEAKQEYRDSIQQVKDTFQRYMPHTIAGKQRDAAILNFRETEVENNYTDWGSEMPSMHRKWVFDIEAKDFYRMMLDGDWGEPEYANDTMGALTERGLMFAMSLDYSLGYGADIIANAYVSPLIPDTYWWGGIMLEDMQASFKSRDWDYFKVLAQSVEDSPLGIDFMLREPEAFNFWQGNPALESYIHWNCCRDVKGAQSEGNFEGRDLEEEMQTAVQKLYATNSGAPDLFTSIPASDESSPSIA